MDRKLCLAVLLACCYLLSTVASTDDAPSYMDRLKKLNDRLEAIESEKLRRQFEETLDNVDSKRLLQSLFSPDDESASKRIIADGSVQLPADTPSVDPESLVRATPCCQQGFTYIDLTSSTSIQVVNTLPGVTVLQKPTLPAGQTNQCSLTALLKINFEKLTPKPCDFCLEAPYCGRRMLRIDLSLSPGSRSGWLFNLGDSSTNDGYGGDGNTQQRDAEGQGRFPNIEFYKNDVCSSGILQTFANAISSGVNHVTLYVSNQHIRVTNDQGLDAKICSECLYALNGQSDAQGINEDLFLGLNRVVTGRTDRNGVGVCSVKMSWLCPCNW